MLRVIRCANTIGVEGSRDELADLLVATARALREWGPWRVGGRGGACEFVEGGETTPGQRLTVEALDSAGTERSALAVDVARDVLRLLDRPAPKPPRRRGDDETAHYRCEG